MFTKIHADEELEEAKDRIAELEQELRDANERKTNLHKQWREKYERLEDEVAQLRQALEHLISTIRSDYQIRGGKIPERRRSEGVGFWYKIAEADQALALVMTRWNTGDSLRGGK